jgi:hypothetical protein
MEGKSTMGNKPGQATTNSRVARLLAVEVLLADPEDLGDDVLEACLYFLRDRLQGTESEDD